MKLTRFLLPAFAILALVSCSSSNMEMPKTAEEVFNEGLMHFKNEKYRESSKYFDIIKLQYPASAYADDAQYYLAEVNFREGEYQLGAFSYNMLRRVYPRSDYSKEALFKTALCYYKLSPPYDREQEHTLKAIQTFSEFQSVYPNDSLYSVATQYIEELRHKLAYREYYNGVIYKKMSYLKAAIIYFNMVIDEYSDTDVAEDAYFEKIRALKEMEKTEELKVTIELFRQVYPQSKYNAELATIEAK